MADKQYLTLELAKTLIGKTLLCSYNDFNKGDHKFRLIDVVERPRGKGGTELRLLTVPYETVDYSPRGKGIYGKLTERTEDIFYELGGEFRQGRGAERLTIRTVFKCANQTSK